MAIQLLKQGKTPDEAFKQLYNDFILPPPPVASPRQQSVPIPFFADDLLNRLFAKSSVTQDLEEDPVPGRPPS
jgi:hypothetical protein